MMVEIYTESTPNPNTLKFVTNKILLPRGVAEFTLESNLKNSPLAAQLLQHTFITQVFIAANFISISKTDEPDWYEVTANLRQEIKSYLQEEKAVFDATFIQELMHANPTMAEASVEQRIKDALAKYVQPAVEVDGGYIGFKSFENGVLSVSMQGACSGCPSSTMTLKNGIENLMKKVVPEVTEVIADNQ